MKNVVGNKVETNRRGKGMGPSCLITKAFSCHLACRTGFIIYPIFLFQAALAAIIKIITSLLPYALFTFMWSLQSGARKRVLLQGLWLAQGRGVGQWPWPPAQAASLAGTAARRGKPVTLTKVFIKGLSCPSPSAVVSGALFRTFSGFIYFYFINIAKNR